MRHGYNFQPGKPEELFNAAKDLVAAFPKDKGYMTAGANKFLRIYYDKVKECMADQQKAD